MELRARIPSPLRRAAMLAALVALAAPATAGAATHATAAKQKKAKAPVVTKVSPMDVAVGETLTIRGKHFKRGRFKNTVVFKRDGARAVFVKAKIGTQRLLSVQVPASLQEFFSLNAGHPVPTRFRIRILAGRFGKKFTGNKLSPIVSAPRPPQAKPPVESLPDGDCDGDGRKNKLDDDDDNDGLADGVELSLSLDPCIADSDGDGVLDKWEFDCDRNGVLNRDQADDDDDLLADTLETAIGTNPCSGDSDGDQVGDGYEFQSAVDLNDDEFQHPNVSLPFPGKRPYPNALFADAGVDYDGDTLTLKEEHDLWVLTWSVTRTDPRALGEMSYSDGKQYSRSRVIASGTDAGRHEPTLSRDGYDKRQQFLDWLGANGYRIVRLDDNAPWWNHAAVRNPYGLFDMNRDGHEEASGSYSSGGRFYWQSELYYYDHYEDGFLSDDERDEDADGLTNYDETHGRMTLPYWAACYAIEKPWHIAYAQTSHVDRDTDGDGVIDGADDSDFDDIPNIMELSRNAASGLDDTDGVSTCKVQKEPPLPTDFWHPDEFGRVNPFNPCLPNRLSRTCPRQVNDSLGAPFDGSPNWYSLN
jgi:hypothetical protein